MSGTTVLASSCAQSTVNAATEVAITAQDDVAGSAPEGTAVHFTVTVVNLGSATVSNVQIQHRPLVDANTSFIQFAQVTSPNPGSFLDSNWGDADGYTWAFNSIPPNQPSHIFVTAKPAKGGRYKTQATATVPGSLDGPWTAVSMTNVGNVVIGDLDVTVHAPTAGPPGLKTISVDVKNLTPSVALPSFQLQVETEVDQTAFPAANVITPDGSSAGNVSWRQQPVSSPNHEKWTAIFNVSQHFQAGTAEVRIPSTVVVHSVRALAGDPMIIDANGAASTWP